MTTKELGELGEKLACGYLVDKGYKILGKNYRITFGEIDIIARKKFAWFPLADKTIHFIEVKALLVNESANLNRKEGFFPEDRVNYRKQQKLRRLAEIWLRKNHYPPDFPYQIDIIGILVHEASRNAKLHYFPNAVGGY